MQLPLKEAAFLLVHVVINELHATPMLHTN